MKLVRIVFGVCNGKYHPPSDTLARNVGIQGGLRRNLDTIRAAGSAPLLAPDIGESIGELGIVRQKSPGDAERRV